MFCINEPYISIFDLRFFLILGCLFSTNLAEAQPKQDSSSLFTLEANLTPIEQWDTLFPFLREKAASWDKNQINYADTLVQLAKDHFRTKLAEAYSISGGLHFNNDDFDKSIIAFQNGLKYIGISDNPQIEIPIRRGIGDIFSIQSQNIKARSYLFQSLNLAVSHSDTLNIVLANISIANTFVDELNLDSSAYHIYLARDLAIAADIASQLPTIYNNIVFLEDEKGNFEIARTFIYKLLSLAELTNDADGLVMGYGNLGYSHGKHGQQYDSAVFYLKLALKYFDPEFSETRFLPVLYKEVSDNYFYMGSADSALVYLQKYIVLHDSIQEKQFNKSVQETEAKYQTEEKEKQIIKAQLEAERQTNLKRLIIGFALGIFAILLVLFLIFRNRQKLSRQQTEISLKLKRAEAQQLRELDQLKSNFFANISHEFRTPLTLILGPIEQLKNNQLKGNIQSYVSMMHRNALRLKELIDQLLDLSKLESGQMNLDLKDGDIFQFSRQLVSSFQSWAMQKNLDYQFDIPSAPLWVQYDRDKYEKILTNLISNAIKYTPTEGYVSVGFDVEKMGDLIKLKGSIKNSGIGILKEDQDKIFQRFYQKSTQNEDGIVSSGIGLALTKELIELYGGTICVDSTTENGTQFIFEIGLSPASSRPISNLPSLKNSRTWLNHTKGTTLESNIVTASDISSTSDSDAPIVLVVEDNEDVRNYIIEQIKDTYLILQAKNGQEGLDLALAQIPDLIITDLMMPEMTGHELTLQLKTDQCTSHIPVIMLTAKANRQDKLKGLENGADDYLTKPFNATELQHRIKNLIKQRQLLKERFSNPAKQLSPKEIAVNSVDEQFLNRLLNFLETEIDNEQLSVEWLAHMIGMSRSQLHRKLKALTDKTPTTFIRSFRMQRAHQLLTQNAGNSSEVSFMVGYNSLAYFSKSFKAEFGLSPSDILKMNK